MNTSAFIVSGQSFFSMLQFGREGGKAAYYECDIVR
jgi:hypothetical protein